MAKDLRQYLQLVRKAGPEFYVEAKRPLKPKFEVCVLQEKLWKEGRFPVIYCPEIEGSKLPLVSNLIGSYEMLGMALDMTPEMIKKGGKAGIFNEYIRRRDNPMPPKEVPASEAPVKEIVIQGKDVDLGLLPISHHYELNPGKYISAAITITRDPDTGILNAGVYRLHVKGKDKTGCALRWVHHGGQIARRYAELGKKMEVVSFIGHHPAVLMGATTFSHAPLETSELDTMGALLGEPLELTKASTVDLPVPARAEIVIEGEIDPSAEMTSDGPFSEAWGYYGEVRPCYLMQIKAITMRRDAIYQDLQSSHPEHFVNYQMSREANIYRAVKEAVPTVRAVHFGPEGQMASNLMYISIKKRTEGQGRVAGLAALNGDIIGKVAIVVDDDVDVFDEHEVLWALATRVKAESDILIVPRMPSVHLNPCADNAAGTWAGYTDAKIMVDATLPVDQPFATRVTPPQGLWKSMKLEDYLK